MYRTGREGCASWGSWGYVGMWERVTGGDGLVKLTTEHALYAE